MHHHSITYYSFHGVALLKKLIGCRCLGFYSSVAEIFVLLGLDAMSHPRRRETLVTSNSHSKEIPPNFHGTQSFNVTFTR